jgi:hypothetical protein
MEQPKALRLAKLNQDNALAWKEGTFMHEIRMDTANELRRLHEVNDSLLQSLKEVVDWLELGDHESVMHTKARLAIAKAKGEQP